MDPTCSGYVLLGRMVSDKAKADECVLQLCAVQIPFGCTLIVRAHTIHGDAALTGKFLMAMTSNHHTMQQADTVLVKPENALTAVQVHEPTLTPRLTGVVLNSTALEEAFFRDMVDQTTWWHKPLVAQPFSQVYQRWLRFKAY